jgi:hypothetical protein
MISIKEANTSENKKRKEKTNVTTTTDLECSS